MHILLNKPWLSKLRCSLGLLKAERVTPEVLIGDSRTANVPFSQIPRLIPHNAIVSPRSFTLCYDSVCKIHRQTIQTCAV